MIEFKNLRVYKDMPKKTGLVKKTIAGFLIAATLFSATGCNREILDTTYGFENAVMLNNGNSVVVPIAKWKDYKGEAVQLITNDGMAILTSSYFASLVSGKSADILATNYAESMTDKSGTVSHYEEANKEDVGFNYQILDFQYNFDKAIIIQNDRAVIIPVAKWKDFNGEQMQIITPENVTVLASNYNTILISDNKSSKKAVDLAEMIVGKDGIVTDFAGDFKNADFNKQLIDLKFSFNKSIMLGDASNSILPLSTWKDYGDGEQFQIKVLDGPTYVCSSFNTILVNDIYGRDITAEKITNALNSNVVNFAKGIEFAEDWYNKQVFDFDFNFQNAVITSGSNSTVLPLKQWNDYDGEQLQFTLPAGVTILSSAVDSGMAAYNTNTITVDDISKSIAANSNNLDPNYKNDSFYNKPIIDTKYSFPYALVVNDKSILILSLDSWRDYSGGEQLQLTLADKTTTFLTTAYDTKLVSLGDSNLSIEEVASWFNDGSKNVVDMTNGMSGNGKFNYQIFDTHFKFNYAIAINGDVATIIPIEKWLDYDGDKNGDGDYTDYTEQLQISFDSTSKIYSDNTNIKLVNASDEEIVEQIALGHISAEGILNNFAQEKGKSLR